MANSRNQTTVTHLLFLIGILSLIAIISFGTGCDRPSKTVKLRMKLPVGMTTVYDFTQRSKGIAMTGDSVLSESTHEKKALYTESVDSLSGDTASWVSVSSISTGSSVTIRDTTVTDTVETSRNYQYLGRDDGEILSLIPIEGVDQEWADSQLEYLKQVQPTFPETDVTVGFTWTKNVKVLLFGETREANGTYVLKNFVRDRGYDCALIEYEGHYILPVDNKDSIATVAGATTITTTGQIYFAYREGIIVQDRTNWVVNSDRTVTYLMTTEDGKHTAGEEQVVSIVSEGDSQYFLKTVTFAEQAP